MDKELLEILACPKCKKAIRLEGEKIICGNCKI
ncbi:MAG TPA: Trm112 family protein, partial [bacterium]|nr:Trm112 family protein [bacterium]